MFNFNDYFEDLYQYSLKAVDYQLIEVDESVSEQFDLHLKDSIETKLDDNYLYISYIRKVFFEPEGIFKMTVSLDTRLQIRNEKKTECLSIDWRKELIDNPNEYVNNACARASMIISSMTSASGQRPLITQPVLSL